ncbi:MAG: hypothetical protein D6788_08640 [Planctomycetota bacterium]|nr:MAG: hypothetical protein D6788_08640 [Planctomycetota bacterium]
MADVIDETQYREAAEIVHRWRTPVLLTHERPDGDALGALAAMRSVLRELGADPTPVLFDELPPRYDLFHRDPSLFVVCKGRAAWDALEGIDGALILDTCTWNQLAPAADWLRSLDVPKLAVDHHATRDDLADRYLIDETAPAACWILYEWIRAVDWPLPPAAAEALFVGLAMDTGWFHHSNTDARALTAAAELAGMGVKPNRLYGLLFQNEPASRVRLLGAALESLELHADGRIAVMSLTARRMREVGADATQTEDIVNEPLRIGTVAVSVLLVEHDDCIRISFRSKAPEAARTAPPGDHEQSRDRLPVRARTQTGEGAVSSEAPEGSVAEAVPLPIPDIDVARVAEAFGGGGHARAAGARVSGSLDEVRRAVIEHLAGLL